MLVTDVVVLIGSSFTLSIAFVSTYLGDIRYAAICDELWLIVLEVLPPVLEAVV